MKKAVALALLSVCLISVSAAPLPQALAINPQTKECGIFWGGDEILVYYDLPAGWEAYYWDDNSFTTPYGKCTTSSIYNCCSELGFNFVQGKGDGGIGVLSKRASYGEIYENHLYDTLFSGVITCIIILVAFLAIILALRKKKK
ncbi:MAG: hypothetical protein NT067_06860 [Candidatus Diapherotrites archaeon]|nr:hypothetical protein [Candidatus Diapherotrites archaeon]